MIFLILTVVLVMSQHPADATQRAQAALAAMAAGDFARVEEQFTSQMQAALPPGRLQGLWMRQVAQAGAHKSCGSNVRVVDIGDKRMVITPCEFARGKVDIQLAFDSSGKISGLVFRPVEIPYSLPTYATPSAYAETAPTVGSGEWALPATLTAPVEGASLPAVILVHGSGPNDRDETVGANKPFKDLAVGLASRGIAVLRYDKRTKVHGAKMASLPTATVNEEVVEDAVAAVRLLRAHPRIDPARVFVLGHSLGGMLVPRIAAVEPAAAGFIVLAGPSRPIEDLIVAQTRYLAAADGTISVEEQKAIDETAALAASIRALKPEDASGGPSIGNVRPSYWLDLRGYDPASAAKAVKTPMLIMQGERDYQVNGEEFARWKAALGTRPDVTFRSYPALNHLFIAGTGPSLPDEYQVAGHVAEEVIRDIAAWVGRITSGL